jgi:2-C-methyl-D-erythritol 4-phosphate cytidylyltransferase
LKTLEKGDIVLIHDAVRPFINRQMIDDCISMAEEYGASAVAVPVTDTLKKEKFGFIEDTLNRQGLWRVQTPQAFRYQDISEAYELAIKVGFRGTDDCVLYEKFLGKKVKIVPGSNLNIKITTAEDLKLAKALLSTLDI